MIEYHDEPTQIRISISDSVSPGQEKIRFRLSQKDDLERIILNLQNMFFLPSSQSNLVNLAPLNNCRIFQNKENKTLYNIYLKEILAQAKQWNNSFLFQPLKLVDVAMSLVTRLDKVYQRPILVHHT